MSKMSNDRVLAVDYGLKNVGLAMGNLESRVATPYGLINNKGNEFLFNELLKIINEWGINVIVFGLPLNMKLDHKQNDIFDKLMNFVDYLKTKLEIKIELFDERLSTFEAKDLLSSQKLKYKQIMARKDSISAQIILDKWFSSSI